MVDLLAKLPPFSFRGVSMPLTGREANHAHESAEVGLQFRNGNYVEITGGTGWRFRYSIPARECIVGSGFKAVFTDVYRRFLTAYLDTTAGELSDPVLGVMQAKPARWNDQIEATKRDGTDLVVEFSQHIEADTEPLQLVSLGSVASEAGKLNAEIIRMMTYEDEAAKLPMDPLQQLAGYGAQIEAMGDRIDAKLSRIGSGLDKLEAQIERLENPDRAKWVRDLRRIRVGLFRLERRAANPHKSIQRVAVNYSKTVGALAAEFKMTLDDFLALNPALALMNPVPAGTKVNRNG